MSDRHPLLPPGVPAADYRITASLADVGNWKARILLGNSMCKGQGLWVGGWDSVGYVMVSLVGEPCFIPVAHSDEHGMCSELLHERRFQWSINPKDFFPIYSTKGGTGVYVHTKQDIAQATQALRLWHAAGGPEVVVKTASYCEMDHHFTIGSKDFVACKGVPRLSTSGLLPLGQRIVGALQGISDALGALRSPDRPDLMVTRSGNVRLRRALDALTHLVGTHPWLFMDTLRDRKASAYVYGASNIGEAAEQWTAHADTLLVECDLDGLAQLVFSHNGLKNKLHMAVREEMREDRGTGDIAMAFGDLDMTHDALGRVSPGLDATAESQATP